jgi:acetoin utilization deacetylase AcuC-like enzyme
MPVSLPLVWSDECLLHEPGGEVWIGTVVRGDEVPARALRIRETLTAAGAATVEARTHDDRELLEVHDAGLVRFLRSAWERWDEAGYPDLHRQDRVVPYIFPHPGLSDRLPPLEPRSPAALTGLYAFDTMTPVGRRTWDAVRGAVDSALTACDLVLDGAPLAYACTRPPGHHVTRSAFGGSCYLNNAAVSAQYLRNHGYERIAIVDVDAHHGNGAQSIFWHREDVLTASVHVDPGAGWFPHFLGGADESNDANLNLPLPPGAGDDAWTAAVETLVETVRRFEATALVVALGVDAARADPESPLDVTGAGFAAAGRCLGSLGLPTVVVQEGGYDLASIGGLVRTALQGIEEGRDR